MFFNLSILAFILASSFASNKTIFSVCNFSNSLILFSIFLGSVVVPYLATTLPFESIKNLGTLTEKERLPYLLQALEDLKKTKDAKEGMASFFEKRVANWLNE